MRSSIGVSDLDRPLLLAVGTAGGRVAIARDLNDNRLSSQIEIELATRLMPHQFRATGVVVAAVREMSYGPPVDATVRDHRTIHKHRLTGCRK